MRQTILACFAATLFVLSPAGATRAATLGAAIDAYRNNRVAEAERMHAEIAADPAATPRVRAAALTELARVDWLARGETDGADAALAGISASPERCAAAALAVRIYREAGDPERPLTEAIASRGECSRPDADVLHVQLARTYLALAAADASQRSEYLRQGQAELNDVDVSASGTPDVAAARFALAMAQRDAGAAFSAWRNYYWLTDADTPQALSDHAGRISALFAAGLAPGAADADVLALITMLIRAGFTDDARLFAQQTGIAARAGDDPAWTRAQAFFTFHETVRAATQRANRDIINGGRAESYGGELTAAMGQLMQAAGLSGDPRAALAQTFGVYGTVGETSGYPSLHGGHLVQDETIQVEQYGRSGALRFIVIDHMLSNGYESWLWDGWAETGGWSTDDGAIVQVRSAYTGGPLNALRRARPGHSRDRFVEAIERAQADEYAALGRDGVATLPATSDRLELQAIAQIVARVGADDAAFVAEHWRATVQYSITLHEGRHALDKAAGEFSGEELEFRAKLSQIALADYPRLGLANIAAQPLGDTPHGSANRRILEGYRAWMHGHRDEIEGFDRAQPTLAQLHLLTDEQIAAAARSMDAWAS